MTLEEAADVLHKRRAEYTEAEKKVEQLEYELKGAINTQQTRLRYVKEAEEHLLKVVYEREPSVYTKKI